MSCVIWVLWWFLPLFQFAFPPHLHCIFFVNLGVFQVFPSLSAPFLFPCSSTDSPHLFFSCLTPPAPHPLISSVCIYFQSLVQSLLSHLFCFPDPAELPLSLCCQYPKSNFIHGTSCLQSRVLFGQPSPLQCDTKQWTVISEMQQGHLSYVKSWLKIDQWVDGVILLVGTSLRDYTWHFVLQEEDTTRFWSILSE